MTVGQDPFFGSEFEPLNQGELQARWQQGAAERADRVHHLIRSLISMAPPMPDTSSEVASWVLNQVTAGGSKGLLFQIDSVLSRLMDAEHERLRTVVEQVLSHYEVGEQRDAALIRALLIEIGYEGD